MKINKRIHTPEGDVLVNCEFTKEEEDVIFTVGLSEMLRVGAIPFTMMQAVEASKLAPGGTA